MEEKLTRDKLKPDEVYKDSNGTIFEWGPYDDSTHSIDPATEFYYNRPGGYKGRMKVTKATPSEKNWLRKCIATGRFVKINILNK